jgi:hypothetical protein
VHYYLQAGRATREYAVPSAQARGLPDVAAQAVAEAGQVSTWPGRFQVVKGVGHEPYKVWVQLIECSPRSMRIKALAEAGTASHGRRAVAGRTLACASAGWERRVIDDAVEELICAVRFALDLAR